jgi:hypothetical protein
MLEEIWKANSGWGHFLNLLDYVSLGSVFTRVHPLGLRTHLGCQLQSDIHARRRARERLGAGRSVSQAIGVCQPI